jgi:cyclase
MLKTRVIPTLLWKGMGLVKGVGFESWRRIGTVLPAIKVFNARDVDELVLLDISATPESRGPDIESLEEWSSECFVPLSVGGGIRTVEHIRSLLLAGADKVVVNTACYEVGDLIGQAANRFGSQCVIAGVDFKRDAAGGYECYSRCGTLPTGREPVEWAKHLEAAGAGEILLTSIERDGSMTGYDVELIRRVTSAVRIPVIASGGASGGQHMAEAVLNGGASAVAAASIYHFTEQTPAEMKQYLAAKGIRVRS